MDHKFLSDLVLPARINQHWIFSGLDSPQNCLDRDHFNSYPHEIIYDYNSRGFRDHEWPTDWDELRSAIWCIGDSFTVGLGQPFKHIWPQVLQHELCKRTINISMDGASNQWIARRSQYILKELRPEYMIIMWSYLNRREDTNVSLEDHDRRIWWGETTDQEDYANFRDCVGSIITESNQKIIHAIIPWAQIKKILRTKKRLLLEGKCLEETYLEDREIQQAFRDKKYVGPIPMLDLARDGHHFDLRTSTEIVRRIVSMM